VQATSSPVGLLPRAMLKTGFMATSVSHTIGVTTTNRDRRASTASGHTGGLLYITTTDRRKMSLVKTSAEHFIMISYNISIVYLLNRYKLMTKATYTATTICIEKDSGNV
jgi:hypothetical protein